MAVDPNSWQALFSPAAGKELSSKPHRTFVTQLVQYVTNGFSPGNLAQNVSGSNRGVKAGALKNFTLDIPAAGGTLTKDVRDSYAVYVSVEITGSGPVILTLNNLLTGSPVALQVTNNAGGNRTFQMAATNGSGTAYTIFAKSASYINMVSTGITMTTGTTLVFSGNSSLKVSTPDLELVYN